MIRYQRLSVYIVFVFCCFNLQAKPLNLVTTEWETFTSDGSHSARLNDFVKQAFERSGQEVIITIERPAFAGSGLNTGKYDGRIDFIDLNPQKTNFSYSQQYFPLRLHLISKKPNVEDVRTFSQIRDARVAIENRYASSPPLRLVREVKWSRNPTTFESIANLAGERSNYLLSDSLMFSEFNRLLYAENEEVLHKSSLPMFVTGLQVSLNNRIESATSILQTFNQAAEDMLADGSVNSIFGIEWILADIDDDGIADWVSSAVVNHPNLNSSDYPNNILPGAYRWDDTNITDQSKIVVDGKTYEDWFDASEYLRTQISSEQRSTRISFLDENAYRSILSKW